MFWFLKKSYKYINPKGMMKHLGFLRRLPKAYIDFCKFQREDA